MEVRVCGGEGVWRVCGGGGVWGEAYMRGLVRQLPIESLWKPWQQRVSPDNHHIAVQSLQWRQDTLAQSCHVQYTAGAYVGRYMYTNSRHRGTLTGRMSTSH